MHDLPQSDNLIVRPLYIRNTPGYAAFRRSSVRQSAFATSPSAKQSRMSDSAPSHSYDSLRKPVHDSAVVFRVSAALVEQAAVSAAKEGMSLSELMRAALRRQLREAA
jgi:predicted HicB family RNase H-like nuclease